MDITAENFPIYKILSQLRLPGIAHATQDFENAVKGGDDEKYSFALGMQTIASNAGLHLIPGVTEEARVKTLRSCLAVFQDVAAGKSKVADSAKTMARFLKGMNPGL